MRASAATGQTKNGRDVTRGISPSPSRGGRNLQEIALDRLKGTPLRLRAVTPELPELLEIVIARALATMPEDRFQSMDTEPSAAFESGTRRARILGALHVADAVVAPDVGERADHRDGPGREDQGEADQARHGRLVERGGQASLHDEAWAVTLLTRTDACKSSTGE